MNFEDFYKLYPRKIAKADAMKAWGKLSQDAREKAIEALPKHCRYWDATTSKEYIPYPASWLNGMRWEDELEIPEPKAVAWWATDKGVMDMGRKLNISPRPGEELPAFKQRVVEKFKTAA